jgi:hypothetical protein
LLSGVKATTLPVKAFTAKQQGLNSRKCGKLAARAEQDDMRYVFRAIFYLVIAGVVGLLGLAIFSELPAPRAEISRQVEAM